MSSKARRAGSVEQDLARVVELYNQGRLEHAAQLCQRLLTHAPTHAPVHYLLGLLRLQAADLAGAQRHLRRAAELNPALPEAWFHLGQTQAAQGAGELAGASYRKAVELMPSHAEAHFNLGLLAEAQGDPAAAAQAYEQALAARPEHAEVLNNLANVQRAQGRVDEAEAGLRRAVQLRPQFAEAWFNLGALLEAERGDDQGAIDALRQALEARPSYAEAHFDLARLLGSRRERRFHALQHYQRAIELRPDYAEALNNLGVLWFEAHQPQRAQDCYERAIAAQPALVEAYNNLGNLLAQRDRAQEARAIYQQALAIRPQFAEALNGLGLVLNEIGELHAAADCYRRALAVKADFPEALANLGTVLQRLGDLEGAAANYRAALELVPSPGLRIKLALMLSPIISSIEQLRAERERFSAAIDELRSAGVHASEEELLKYPDTCFYLAYHGENDRALLEKVAAFLIEACPTLGQVAPHALEPRRVGGRIRIGFLSRFLYNHSVGRFFNPIIAHLASLPAFEVVLLTLGEREDVQLDALGALCAAHERVPMTSLAAARRLVERQQLDVLVYPEIGMDPFTYYLAFARLARVQCVLQGHSVTSGLPNQDYFISSALIEPPEGDRQYSESLIRLPCLPMYLEPPVLPQCSYTRAELGLPEQGALYLCPMKLQKLHPQMDQAVAAILRADAAAWLLLVEDHTNPLWHERVRQRLAVTMPDVVGRVRFVPWARHTEALLAMIRGCDVILDSFHHGGATTAHLCLACGMPMVSWITDTSRSRFIRAYYELLGVEDCMADSPQAYVEIALRLGRDAAYREQVRARIEDNRHRLYDNDRVFSEYATFFREVAQRSNPRARLTWPYRPLRSVRSWCEEHDLPYQVLEDSVQLSIPSPELFGIEAAAVESDAIAPEIYAAELRDVEAVGGENVLLVDDARCVLYDLALHYPPERVDAESNLIAHRLGDQVLLRSCTSATQMIECAIHLCGRATSNYYHWLFEYLPRLRHLASLPAYADWPILIDEGLHPNLLAALRRLVPDRRLIEIAPLVRRRVARLLVLAPSVWMPIDFRPGVVVRAPDIIFLPAALEFLRLGLGSGTSASPGRGRRLYLHRGDAAYRRLLNEPEIEAALLALGFETVHAERLSLQEQTELFAQADMIAGPTGAAMANLLFTPAHCQILVLYYPAVPYFYFSNLAAALGRRLVYVLGEAVRGSHPVSYQLDFSVEVNQVCAAATALLDDVTSGRLVQAITPSRPRAESTHEPPHIGFLAHIPELLNHYRCLWQHLEAGTFEIVNAGSQRDFEEIARIAAQDGVACCDMHTRLARQQRYACLVSNHPIDPSGVPLIKRLGRRNVRLMYALGKAGWNLREWNALYDAILCFGPYHVESLGGISGPLKIQVGYPRFDAFFRLAAQRPALLAAHGCDPDKPTVVWLPTWKALSSVGLYDAQIAALRETCNVVVKVHPLMTSTEPQRAAALADHRFDRLITDSSDNIPLYVIADFLLCDYGGPAFGGLYADRNVLLLNVPGAAQDELTGEDSPDILLRQAIVNIDPDAAESLRSVLSDESVWARQREARAQLRQVFFAPYYGFAAQVAALTLRNLDLILGQNG